MINSTLLKKVQVFKMGKNPVVVLPMNVWDTLTEQFDTLEEYYKMSTSVKYKKDIARARVSKKWISAKDVYKKLGLV
ncbi:hypothetical protein HY061_02870 [Candidatus Azambacteria bacterium]|nr:hypothetical protein [Candidatus Azambacteria bacterium]